MDKDSLYIFEAIQYILRAKKNIIIDSEQFAKTSEKIKELYKPYQIKSYVVQAAGLLLPILIIISFTPNDGKIWAIYFSSIISIFFITQFILIRKFFEPNPQTIENTLDPSSQNIFRILDTLTDLISNKKLTCKVRQTDDKPKQLAARIFARDFGILALLKDKSKNYYLSKSEIDEFLRIGNNSKIKDMSRTSNSKLRFGHIIQHVRGQDLEDLLAMSRQYAETKKLFAIDILEIACKAALTCITNEEISLTIEDNHSEHYRKGRLKDASDLTVELGCNANTPRSWYKEIHFPQYLSDRIANIIKIESDKKGASKKKRG